MGGQFLGRRPPFVQLTPTICQPSPLRQTHTTSHRAHFLENGVEITIVQQFLGHASLATTARYLHVREKRLGQIRSPLGLLRTDA